MTCHPAELSSPSDAAISPSIVSVATDLAVFQTWTSSPLKSCNCFMEAEHTNKNIIESFVSLKDHNPGDINPNYVFACGSQFHSFTANKDIN
ncbi:hypothetical protein QL285_003436 [Trifolium repens]|jgi:hypothetical protein|nr:hypothetical protein QL285_003436 [Trifolium repens]